MAKRTEQEKQAARIARAQALARPVRDCRPGCVAHQHLVDQSPLPLVAFDWGRARVDYTFDGKQASTCANLDEFLRVLDGVPHLVVCEATVESWEFERRVAFIEQASAAGHEVYTFRPTHTARARISAGDVKSDEQDALTIHRIATTGVVHLNRLLPVTADDRTWWRFRDALASEYVRLRLSETGKADLGRELAELVKDFNEVSPKGALRGQLVNPLGKCDAAQADADTASARRVLCGTDGKLAKWTSVLLFAAKHSASRADYERLLGLSGSAYPSILRSEVYNWGYMKARTRENPELRPTFGEFRRWVRWVYHQAHAAGLTPESRDTAYTLVLGRFQGDPVRAVESLVDSGSLTSDQADAVLAVLSETTPEYRYSA